MMTMKVRIDKRGRILLPMEYRKKKNLKSDDVMILSETEGGLYLSDLQEAIDKIHRRFADKKQNDISVTDEFIRSRRRQAEQE